MNYQIPMKIKFTVCAVGNISNVRFPVPFSIIVRFFPDTTGDGNFTLLDPPVKTNSSIPESVRSLKLKSTPAAKVAVSTPSPPFTITLAELPSEFSVNEKTS